MQIVKISASQINTFKLCPRKWAFQYIHGHREPTTRAQALGSLVHKILEAYLTTGAVPDPNYTWQFGPDIEQGKSRVFYPGKIALSMMPAGLFPKPGTGKVEHKFSFILAGVEYNGIVDWHESPRDTITLGEHNTTMKLATVIDHKTSADPIQYGKTDESLRDDIQALMYAFAMQKLYRRCAVRCIWNYGANDGAAKKARVAEALFEPDDIIKRFCYEIEPVAKKMRELYIAKTDALVLPPNGDACSAYHKQCPHVETCNLSTKERLGNLMSGNALIDTLLAESSVPTATPGDEPSVNPPEADATPAPATTPEPAAKSPIELLQAESSAEPPAAATPSPKPAAPTFQRPGPNAPPPKPAKPAKTVDYAQTGPTSSFAMPPAKPGESGSPVEGFGTPSVDLTSADFRELVAEKVAQKIVEYLFAK